jgi:hypothetical protein
MSYTAKITDAKKEFSLSDDASFLNVSFEILLDGVVVDERLLGFPLGTSQEDIITKLQAYCQMYENDHKVVAEVAKTAALEAEAEGVLSELRGKTV